MGWVNKFNMTSSLPEMCCGFKLAKKAQKWSPPSQIRDLNSPWMSSAKPKVGLRKGTLLCLKRTPRWSRPVRNEPGVPLVWNPISQLFFFFWDVQLTPAQEMYSSLSRVGISSPRSCVGIKFVTWRVTKVEGKRQITKRIIKSPGTPYTPLCLWAISDSAFSLRKFPVVGTIKPLRACLLWLEYNLMETLS